MTVINLFMKPKIIIPLIVFLVFTFLFFFTLKNLPQTHPGLGVIPSKINCEISNCHGLDITCGPKSPEACTNLYQLGDRCRQHAICQIINNQCQPNYSSEFNSCKNCVDQCLEKYQNDQIKLFQCESKC